MYRIDIHINHLHFHYVYKHPSKTLRSTIGLYKKLTPSQATIYHTRGEHANYYITDEIKQGLNSIHDESFVQ
jgi:hypothetical protein